MWSGMARAWAGVRNVNHRDRDRSSEMRNSKMRSSLASGKMQVTSQRTTRPTLRVRDSSASAASAKPVWTGDE